MPVAVTHCDIYYLSRVIALVDSLLFQAFEFEVWVFVHDDESLEKLTARYANRIKVLQTEILEENFKELKVSKKSKNRMEYLFALTPFMIKHAQLSTGQEVWYFDADILLLGEFNQFTEIVKGKDVVVSGHNFPSRLKYLEKYGKFNVGIIFFSTSSSSAATLDWWSQKCVEDTSVFQKSDVYGDQIYLNEFPNIAQKFGVFSRPEMCGAPWNLETVKELPPLTYHYSGFRKYRLFTFYGLSVYKVLNNQKYRESIYRKYRLILDEIEIQTFGKVIYDERKLPWRSIFRAIYYKDLDISRTKLI